MAFPAPAARVPLARAPRPAPHDAAPAIQTRGLTKTYQGKKAVDNFTITVPRGGVVGFVGPNGAGKTTTIRMLLGLIRPTAGAARVLGHDIHHMLRYLPRVGALIESPAFYPQLSGRRNLEVLALLGGHDKRRVPALLSQVGLANRADDHYKSYSLGMKQRLGIAAALLPDPELLILDEPTNGLDPAGIREMRALLRSIGDSGKTVFVSSHLLAEIQKMCDRLIILRKGRLLFQGSVDQLLASQRGLVLAPADKTKVAALAALVKSAGYSVHTEGSTVIAQAPGGAAGELNQRAMKAGIVLSEIHAHAVDLEETVLRMTGAGAL